MSRVVNARGLGVVGVVIIHATGPLIGSMTLGHATTDTAANFIVLLFNQLSRYCVPLFFFLSAYLYAKKYCGKKIDYPVLLIRRLRLIGLPYLFWSLLYIILGMAKKSWNTEELDSSYLLKLILFGEASGHLYFIPALFQFYMLLPLFLIFNELTRKKGSTLVWILAIFLFSLVLYEAKMRFLTIGEIAQVVGRSCFVWWWLPYLLLGGVLGSRGAKIERAEKIIVLAVSVTAMAVMLYETLCVYNGSPYYYATYLGERGLERIVTFARPSAAFFALSCLLLLGDYLEWSQPIPESILTRLGTYSFGVYLAHPLANQLVLGVLHRSGFTVQGTLTGVIAPLFVGSALALAGTIILASSPKISWSIGIDNR